MFTSFLARGRSVAVAATLVAAAAMPASAETITVTIENLSFKPTEVKAKVSDTILWVNKDVLDHTATARDKSFDIIQTLTKAGSFDFYCKYHPNMTGRLVIEP
jgi:plastocyanin